MQLKIKHKVERSSILSFTSSGKEGMNFSLTERAVLPIPGLSFNVTFIVTDKDSNPLEGASVIFDGVEKLTNSGGVVIFLGVNPGLYNYDIAKEGYSSMSENINVVNNNVSKLASLYGEVPASDALIHHFNSDNITISGSDVSSMVNIVNPGLDFVAPAGEEPVVTSDGIYFDGSKQLVAIHDDSFNFGPVFTFSCWIKASNNFGINPIVLKKPDCYQVRYLNYVATPHGRKIEAMTRQWNKFSRVYADYMSYNNWVHILTNMHFDGGLAVYKNNTLLPNSIDQQQEIKNNNVVSDITLGLLCEASIEEVKFFNRELTAQERSDLNTYDQEVGSMKKWL